jgi:hypothetical protein
VCVCVCVCVWASLLGWSVPLDHHCNRSLVERGVARLACNCNQAGARADQDSVCGLHGVILCCNNKPAPLSLSIGQQTCGTRTDTLPRHAWVRDNVFCAAHTLHTPTSRTSWLVPRPHSWCAVAELTSMVCCGLVHCTPHSSLTQCSPTAQVRATSQFRDTCVSTRRAPACLPFASPCVCVVPWRVSSRRWT